MSILILTSNKEYNFFYQQKEKDSYLVWRCTFNILDVRLHHNCFITLLTKGFRMNYFLIHRLCICPSSNYFAWISMIILFADMCTTLQTFKMKGNCKLHKNRNSKKAGVFYISCLTSESSSNHLLFFISQRQHYSQSQSPSSSFTPSYTCMFQQPPPPVAEKNNILSF